MRLRITLSASYPLQVPSRYVPASMQRTDGDGEADKAEPRHGIPEEVWAAGTEEGGPGAVVFAVVGGVEAVFGSLVGLTWIGNGSWRHTVQWAFWNGSREGWLTGLTE